MLSDLGAASSDVGASSTPSSSPTAWMDGTFAPERSKALRQSIRGMEAQLVDLVFESSTAGGLMGWLRMPLGCAAAAGNLAVVQRLLAAGVFTETPPEMMRPPPLLHLAAIRGRESVVEDLLKAGVDVNETDSARHDRTALHCAAMAGGDSVVRALTCAGASMDVLDATGWTPLHYACARGHRAVVVFLLLNRARAPPTVSEEDSPLHLAAYHNHAGVIEDLLSFGKAFTEFHNAKGLTALHVAAKCGQVEACIALLRGGADVADRGGTGLSCLDIAAWNGYTGRLLQVLTTAKTANVGGRRGISDTALYYAVRANKPHTMRDLVALGANINFLKAGKLPNLHYAAGQGAYGATEALLLAGADVNRRFSGKTSLHMACSGSHINTVRLLLHWGADEKATDPNENTPSDVVGTVVLSPGTELQPVELLKKQHLEDRIRSMLATAPADRIWRRRGWLVLCRSRWFAKIREEDNKPSKPPFGVVPSYATSANKRRGKIPVSALAVKPRDFSLGKGKARGRTEGGSRHLPEAAATAAAAAKAAAASEAEAAGGLMRLGPCGFLTYGSARKTAGVARLAGRTRFVTVVEQLLLLREDSVFREIVTFL
ncbi:unnamed protein product [Laminaria digitata]